MPTYAYECRACGHEFEQFQSITAKPIRTCPQCKARRVRRLVGAGAGIIFRGSGFYQTDYRSEDYKKKAKAESSSSDSSGAKGSRRVSMAASSIRGISTHRMSSVT